MRLRRRQRQRQRRQRLRKLSNKLRETAEGSVGEEKAKRATNTGTPRIEVGRKTSARVRKREGRGREEERQALPDTHSPGQPV